jgi:hypothetical protein
LIFPASSFPVAGSTSVLQFKVYLPGGYVGRTSEPDINASSTFRIALPAYPTTTCGPKA